MSPTTPKSARVSQAAFSAVEAARRAQDAGNAGAFRHAVKAAIGFLKRCDDRDVIALAVSRLIEIARRCPASRERDAALARVEAIRGPTGTA